MRMPASWKFRICAHRAVRCPSSSCRLREGERGRESPPGAAARASSRSEVRAPPGSPCDIAEAKPAEERDDRRVRPVIDPQPQPLPARKNRWSN